MPRHKSLLHASDIEFAQRQRTCHHNDGHKVAKGESCLVLREGQFSRKVYCRPCAKEMVDQARVQLTSIESKL